MKQGSHVQDTGHDSEVFSPDSTTGTGSLEISDLQEPNFPITVFCRDAGGWRRRRLWFGALTSFRSWSTPCESPSLGLSNGVLHERKLVSVTALLARSCPVPYKSVTFPIIFPGRSGFPRSLFRGRENCDKQARFVGRLMLTTFTTRTHFYTDG